MNQLYAYTLWPSIYRIDQYERVTETWADLVARFSRHAPVAAKDKAPGFSPYSLLESPGECPAYVHSDGKGRTGPHRCNGSVDRFSLLVYDVDEGSMEDVAACDERLGGYARLWYSSYSYSDSGKMAFRLVLPLLYPINAQAYGILRKAVWEQFRIPANAKQCGGASHFYYLPSCPTPGVAAPIVDASGGRPIFPGVWVSQAVLDADPCSAARRGNFDAARLTKAEAADALRLGQFRVRLQSKAARLARLDPRKADVLQRALAGKPLADHGSRNAATLLVTGVIAYELPEATLGELMAILEPSIEAMQSAGSSVSHRDAERMFAGAMRSAADYHAAKDEEDAAFARLLG